MAKVVLIKFLLKACLWLVDFRASLFLCLYVCEALGSRGFRDREKTSSSGFFLLLPSQGTEGQRQTQREERMETRTRNKDCLEKNNIKQTLDRREVGCGGLSQS